MLKCCWKIVRKCWEKVGKTIEKQILHYKEYRKKIKQVTGNMEVGKQEIKKVLLKLELSQAKNHPKTETSDEITI